MKYKDYPKHDLRRCLSVLVSIEDLGIKASAHYIALSLECTRAEVIRSIALAQHQLMMAIVKIGPVYRIDSWGLLSRDAVARVLRSDTDIPTNPQLRASAKGGETSCAREMEARLLSSLVHAVKTSRPPDSHAEADVFRFVAQLLKTRFPSEGEVLSSAAKKYFTRHRVLPRSFPQVISDGLVVDVPRLRHAVENKFGGISTW